jgi:DNA polymerase-3 subunit alpha
MAIKDVARVQKLPLSEANALAKLVPDRIPNKKSVTLKDAIASVPELQQAEASSDELVRDTMKYAKMLEGNVRGTGVHACGTIICRDDITDWVPVCLADDKETGEKMLVTQYEGSVIEDTGLIKMDFLGLKTLSIIKDAVENIKLSRGIDVDIDTIPNNDPATYKLYCEGRTIGTFQFESAGMQKYLRELQPSTFEDLIAMNALYRPGPMDYIPDFIDRKLGRKPISYDIPIMEKYLKDTYGITVYQEQVMLLSRLLAGFTRGESDTLRKAMGKKQKEKLDHLKPQFIAGGQKNGHKAETLEKIWADWEKFASYAFNKSHATCYSWVAYQTAYLKANYPAEYMAAVMSRSLSNMTDITKLMDECKAMGIQVLGPDVNESNLKFTVNKEGNIRFGLGAVKGVGEKAVQSVVDERNVNGSFKNVADLVQRVNLNSCNKKNLECMALAGGLDGFGLRREQYFVVNDKGDTYLEQLIRYGGLYQMEKASMANSLFGGNDAVDTAVPEPQQDYDKWSDLEKLNKERELIGIYLSSHPLDDYRVVLDYMCNTKMADLDDKAALNGKDLTMGGIVTSVRRGISKSGKPYGIAKVEDYSGSAEFAFFGNDWATYQGYLMEGILLFIKARCQGRQWRQDELEIKVTGIKLLSDVKEKDVEKLTMSVPLDSLDTTWVSELSDITTAHPGHTKLSFQVFDPIENLSIDLDSRTTMIMVGKELLLFLEDHSDIKIQIN